MTDWSDARLTFSPLLETSSQNLERSRNVYVGQDYNLHDSVKPNDEIRHGSVNSDMMKSLQSSPLTGDDDDDEIIYKYEIANINKQI